MNTSPLLIRPLHAALAAGMALLIAGCASSVNFSSATYKAMLTYQPERSPTQIDATVALEVTHKLSPEVRAEWKRYFGQSDAMADNYGHAVAEVISDDIVNSGVFSRINPASPDLIVTIQSEELMKPAPLVRATVEVTDAATKQVICRRTREASPGSTRRDYQLKPALQRMMAALRADMVTDILDRIHRNRKQAEQTQAEAFAKAALPELLVASDQSVATARERNRAIIAAKNQQLPGILRDQKTDDLTALVVKIEQVVLDLNHESEVAKDRAQQAAAANGDQRQIEALRDLTISYRERIELLKPILAAIKEEIANRNR